MQYSIDDFHHVTKIIANILYPTIHIGIKFNKNIDRYEFFYATIFTSSFTIDLNLVVIDKSHKTNLSFLNFFICHIHHKRSIFFVNCSSMLDQVVVRRVDSLRASRSDRF